MNHDGLDFPELFFFQPKKIIRLEGNRVDFIYLNMVDDEILDDYELISNRVLSSGIPLTTPKPIRISMRIFKDEYFKKAEKLLQHIHRGDIYEANFCQEFYAENTEIDTQRTYQKLNSISEPPFAAYLKRNELPHVGFS